MSVCGHLPVKSLSLTLWCAVHLENRKSGGVSLSYQSFISLRFSQTLNAMVNTHKAPAQRSIILLRSEIPSGMCAKLRTVAASNNRVHMPWSLYYCLFAPRVCMVLFFTHIPFVVNHTINATPPERLQQYTHLPFPWTVPALHLGQRRVELWSITLQLVFWFVFIFVFSLFAFSAALASAFQRFTRK